MDTIIAALATIAAAVIGAYVAHALRRRDQPRLGVDDVSNRRMETATAFSVIKGVSFSMDEVRDQQHGMSIFVDLSLCNVAGVECSVAAYFSDATGQPLQDLNGVYRTYDNQVATSARLRASSNEEVFRNEELWIPYEELHLSIGRHGLTFYLAVVREATHEVLASTGDYSWTFDQA